MEVSYAYNATGSRRNETVNYIKADYNGRVKIGATFKDSTLLEETDSAYKYSYYRDYDIVWISKNEYNYVMKREQGDAAWTCEMTVGGFSSQIPYLSSI